MSLPLRSGSDLPFRPKTGVTTYDRLETSKLNPIVGALQTSDVGVIVEEASTTSVATYSPGGPRFAIWTARTPRPLRLRGLSRAGSDGPTKRGTTMVIAPHTPTWWDAPEGTPGAVIISIEPKNMEHILQAAAFSALPDWASLENVQDPTVQRYSWLLQDEVARPGGADQLIVSSVVVALTAHVLRSYSTASGVALTDAAPVARLPAWRMRRIQDYIAEHLSTPMTLTSLAQTVGLSASHFARAFRASTGLSPHAYVIEQRIELARRLLQTTDLAISEIALRAGFASQAHMTVTFKRQTGTTPARARRSRRE